MNEQSPFRLAMLGMLLLGLFAALFTRLWYLQLVIEQEAQAEARSNLFRTVFIPAPRGRVFDVNSNVLIDNRLVNEVTIERFTLTEAFPGEEDQRNFAIKLAREISAAGFLIKAADVIEAIDDQRYGLFDKIPIATDVPERFAIVIGERVDEFPGVGVQKTTVRSYPYGNLAGHVLGYVGPVFAEDLAQLEGSPKLYRPTDEIGKQGVERSYEDILRGTPGVQVIEVDREGNRIGPPISSSEPIPGNDIRLTLDINLQALAEQELARGIREARTRREQSINSQGVAEELDNFEAPGGAMVLLDPDGARILAMATYPTYDQRIFLDFLSDSEFELLSKDPTAPLLNRATQAAYAPGSTFKLITAYAAMDTGLLGDRGFLGLNQVFVDKGIWRVGDDCFGAGCTIENAGRKELGDIDIRSAISQSSNVYFGQLGFQFQVRRGFQSSQLISVANDFGFAELTDALPAARAGAIPPPETAGEAANLAVGQGRLESTPLQMANAYAVLASRGKVYSPMIGDAALDPATGEEVISYEPRLRHELYMPDEFYEPMISGMAGVVAGEGGTAVEAFEDFPLARFQVLGKTGTVEVAGKQDSAAFAAFGPWPNPEYAAVVYLEEAGLGGESAAPVMARVFERIADNDIAVVPTEAEADDLVSEAQAAEEERLRTEREAELEARAAEIAAGEGPGFEVLIPGSQVADDGASDPVDPGDGVDAAPDAATARGGREEPEPAPDAAGDGEPAGASGP